MKLFRPQLRSILLVLAIAFVALPGCQQIQAKLNTDVDNTLALALPDLDAATARAKAANDPNPAHAMCFSGLADGIRAAQAADSANAAATGPVAGPAGVADAAEALLLSDNQPLTIVLPPLAPGVKSACYATIGELRVKATVDAIKFSSAITATLHKLKLG